MPKLDLREALLENEERKGDTCTTCNAPVVEGFEPHCIPCAEYRADVERGLFDSLENEIDD